MSRGSPGLERLDLAVSPGFPLILTPNLTRFRVITSIQVKFDLETPGGGGPPPSKARQLWAHDETGWVGFRPMTRQVGSPPCLPLDRSDHSWVFEGFETRVQTDWITSSIKQGATFYQTG